MKIKDDTKLKGKPIKQVPKTINTNDFKKRMHKIEYEDKPYRGQQELKL